jgi:hypothetical protein
MHASVVQADFSTSDRKTTREAMMRGFCLSTFTLAATLWALSQPVSAASVNDVLGACDRTAGCGYSQNKNGDISGCSKNACFYCPADGSRQCTGVTKARTAGKGGKGQVDIGGVKLDRAGSSSKAARAIKEHQAGQTATSNDLGKTKSSKSTSHKMSDTSSKSTSGHSDSKSKMDRASSGQQMQHSSSGNKKH